jgi:hypothetical protein
MEDVVKWAWILSGESTDDIALRFLSTPSKCPLFLLLEILRRDILKVKTLKMLLVYIWDQLLASSTRSLRPKHEVDMDPSDRPLRNSPRNLTTLSEAELDSIIRSEIGQKAFTQPGPLLQSLKIEENEFSIMISRLLYQTRRIWPPAMVSVAHMVAPYMHSIAATKAKIGPRTFARLCKLHNYVLGLLALPASINPLQSMVHNWTAQKSLLELASRFVPSLTLDQNSYRAVVRVLAASKKSLQESKVAALRTRSWPPWRVDQDGMDAQRSPEEDLSRVIVAIMRARESGYSGNSHDDAMSIIGGQEPDGTPTIQTRKLIKFRGKHHFDDSDDPDSNSVVWAARVEATRDVNEAWSAFSEFEHNGGQPHLAMYLAMFEKLNYENARVGRGSSYEASPGDGKEVLPVANDNFSDFYRSRLQPPSFDMLYEKMVGSGIRPSGRCLSFLLRHARTTDEGIRYMRDSGEFKDPALLYLAGGSETTISPDALKTVPPARLAEFISMICRFAPRVTLSTIDDVGTDLKLLEVQNKLKDERSGNDHPMSPRSIIHKMQSYAMPHVRRGNPLHQAIFILTQSRTRFRPAWYALFRALARGHVIISRDLVGDPKNDQLAWRVAAAALRDFHNCGLELDPDGFHLISRAFEKFAMATMAEDQSSTVLDGSHILKTAFRKLSESEARPHKIPKLLHSISGVHLHQYIRCMGIIEDYDEIMFVLNWMFEHYRELEEIGSQSRNGPKQIRRTLVAIRVFCSGTGYEEKARRLVDQVERWDGWPRDMEAELYVWRGANRSNSGDGDMVEEEMEKMEDDVEEGEERALVNL